MARARRVATTFAVVALTGIGLATGCATPTREPKSEPDLSRSAASSAAPSSAAVETWQADAHDAIGRGDAEAAWAIASPRAEAGSPDAMVLIGSFHRDGFGTPQDPAMAVRWFERAARLDHPAAMNLLAVQYARGWGVAADDAEAVRLYQRAAELGYAEAQYNLAVRYGEGRGVTRDPAAAEAWYEKAVAQEHVKAMNNLGLLWLREGATTAHRARAIELWQRCADLPDLVCTKQLVAAYNEQGELGKAFEQAQRAADLGDPEAQYILATMYFRGRGVARDEQKAFLWRERSARGGWPPAQLHVAYDCLQGDVPGCDDAAAFGLAETAAESGLPAAQHLVSQLHHAGRGTPANAALASRWLQRAAESGHPRAQIAWANHLWNNDGSRSEAVEILKLAAEAGEAQAMSRLGNAWERGFGPVAPDLEQAERWYREGASLADPQSMVLLASLLLRRGAVHAPEAVLWLERASAAGDLGADEILGNLFASGRGVGRDRERAFSHWMKAAQGGSALSQNNVGYSLLTGSGVAADLDSGLLWLHRAADQNQPNALLTLAGLYARGRGVERDLSMARDYAEAALRAGADADAVLSYLDDVADEGEAGSGAEAQAN